MPLVFRERGWRFHFYSDEGLPREPVHIHVAKAGADLKLWLYPEVRVAYNRGVSEHEVRQIKAIVHERRREIEKAWNDHFA